MAEGGPAANWRSTCLELPDGASLRLVHWPPPPTPRATVLLLHGRTEFNEKYAETAEDLIALGFDVRSFDWRGQGLSTRVLPDPHRGHVADYDLLAGDLQLVIEHVCGEEGGGSRPIVLLAHSMGGLVAMCYLASGRADVAAAALSAPLLGIGPGSFPAGLARVLSRLALWFGKGDSFALTQQRWRPGADSFEKNPLTSDARRYAAHQQWLHDQPGLALGGVTWGWLDATFRACDGLFRQGGTDRIAVPLMLGLAGADVVVNRQAIADMAALVPGAVLKTYPDARHELMMERDDIRDAFLDDFDRFLKDQGI